MEKHNIVDSPYLNCNIFSVHNLPVTEDYFHMVENIYFYNSLTSGIIIFKQETIQIPEFEIQDLDLLHTVDLKLINEHSIPVIRKIFGVDEEFWKVDLLHYEYYKLQSNSS